jgi:hypothetical protein
VFESRNGIITALIFKYGRSIDLGLVTRQLKH